MVSDRLRLTRKLDGLKRLYIEGDIDEGEYRQQNTPVAAALAALPEDRGNPDEAVGRRLTGFLRDLAGAWQVATPAERNKIARQLFVDVIVENRTAVAVVPRPDFRPFSSSFPPWTVSTRTRKCVLAEATGFGIAVASS